jgi:hypothetical protein
MEEAGYRDFLQATSLAQEVRQVRFADKSEENARDQSRLPMASKELRFW